MDDKYDYLRILNALDDIPFPVGKKLLIDYLQGSGDNESIERNSLSDKESFGSLAYESQEIEILLDNLLKYDLVRYTTVNGKKFWKVLELTNKGRKEINHPLFFKNMQPKLKSSFNDTLTGKICAVTDDDKKLFLAFGKILEKFNDEQKKAIISDKESILCIAGAGSGKTTVLTNRIEFLINCKSVDPKKILAITFTRKARTEMKERLFAMQNTIDVSVETFNSFCERILRQYNDLIYDKEVKVLEYRDKIQIISKALMKINKNMERAINIYFTPAQKRLKTPEQLANIFMNDCFFIRDYMKLKSCDVDSLSADSPAAKLVFDVCSYIESYMYNNGLRDFADQLVDTMALFRKHTDLIPSYSHILIDEYQDVNSMQMKLLDVLNPENIFAVGDPRQSIYGWRGSDIRYLMNFDEKYPKCQLLILTENYRSTKPIVDLINAAIKYMNISDLKSSRENEPQIQKDADIRLLKFDNEDSEFEFVVQRILSSAIPRKEIFVLARTNRQLVELSGLMQARGITYVIRSDELRKTAAAKENDITLATIHAIKGLEAEMVFVIGCTYQNFPCRGSEHPVMEMVKLEEYNKEDEEKRLFYVAMSRAKKLLYMTYSAAKPTPYITDEMLTILGIKKQNNLASSSLGNSSVTNNFISNTNNPFANKPSGYAFAKPSASSAKMISRLKEWRLETARREGKAAFIIMHDSTLFEIAEKMPLSLQELGKINGIGPAKITKYGEELMDIINGY